MSTLKANTITNAAGTGAPTFPYGIDGAIGFRAHSLGGTPTMGNPIVWTTEEFDSGSNYNAATGRFTVPYTGIYTFSCGLQWASGATILSIYLNGVQKCRICTLVANGTPGSVTLSLTAGDLIDVRPLDGAITGAPGGPEYSNFMGFKVS